MSAFRDCSQLQTREMGLERPTRTVEGGRSLAPVGGGCAGLPHGAGVVPAKDFFTREKGCSVKACTKCGVEQPLTAFYRDVHFAGDLRPECKACSRAKRRERSAAGLTQAAERARYARSPQHRARIAAQTRKWKARNPEKVQAERLVATAIQRGTLHRRPCTVCGAKAHAHHADYTKPLKVQWLCPLHHARQHVAEGRLDHRRVAS